MLAHAIEKKSEQACFGGCMGFYAHASRETGSTMRFGVFLPAQARRAKVPALYYLAGLTCNEETFFMKAGAQRIASELGLALVACDTSPRGLDLPGDSESWDFGVGAGFYLDATKAPWSAHYRMGSYVDRELPELIEANFPIDGGRRGIFGHSMGGHGALVTALRSPARWHSVSAFAPICHPVEVPWGRKAFSNYLGEDRAEWARYDACLLMRKQAYPGEMLVDQGLSDPFLERELKPEHLEAAARDSGQKIRLRRHADHDHSYWFVQTFVEDHLRHHADALGNG